MEEIVVAIIALAGTAIGSLGGILAANRLTTYRIEQLEKKVELHNHIMERTYRLEEQEAVLEERVKVANHRIDDLEKAR